MSSQGPGSGFVPAKGVVAVGALIVAVAGLAIYSLLQLWPPPTPAGSTSPPAAASVSWLIWKLSVPRDSAYLVVVMAAGALGASVHALRSLSWYVGNRNMRMSWVLPLVLLPIVGALLALLAYLVVRAGLVAGPVSSDAVNPWGFVALAALVGLFTDQTLIKLKDVFETLLAPAQKGADHGAGAPLIDQLSVTSGQVGTELHILGGNLAQVTDALFGDLSAKPMSASDGEVVVKVPTGATTGLVSVVGPGGRATSAQTFEIK